MNRRSAPRRWYQPGGTYGGSGSSQTSCAGSPSACQDPPPNPNSLTISATVGDEVTKNFELTSANTTGKISGISCPASVSTSTTVQNLWISIVNPTTRTVTVGLWDGPQVSTDPKVDTIMAWYPTPVVPKTAADQKACTSINDECGTSGAECAGSPWSNLSTTNAASIPAGGTITVYVGGYLSTTTGKFKLHAKTEN